jgi:hypothetical protein
MTFDFVLLFDPDRLSVAGSNRSIDISFNYVRVPEPTKSTKMICHLFVQKKLFLKRSERVMIQIGSVTKNLR